MIVVHHLNNSRSQRILWLLEELGAPYEIKFYQRDATTNLAPPELKGVHPLGKMIDGAARDRVAFANRPFDRGDAAMPRQQRGMVADPAEPCGGEGIATDPRVAVRGDDQVGPRGDFTGHHEPWIGLHDDFDPRSPCRGGKPVLAIGHHHPGDLDPMVSQHVECRHAEMAGADEGNAHGYPIRSRNCVIPR